MNSNNTSSQGPLSTYRIQLNHLFTFRDLLDALPYLKELGISTLYLSPFLKARSKSLHGYDITDHNLINPDIGSEEEFQSFLDQIKTIGMKILLDVVPNHMCIADPSNAWWMDVLENGPSSPTSDYFDIDWRPPKEELNNKVLLPFLGDQYGRVLDNAEIKIVYQSGAFWITYFDFQIPLAPKSWISILELCDLDLQKTLDISDPSRIEFESIMTALHHLPPRDEVSDEKIKERLREKEVIKFRLDALIKAAPLIEKAVLTALMHINGTKGVPESFDLLEKILADQAYRFCFWRVAADEINYRRFFDINDLAAIRVEKKIVFDQVHKKIFQFLKNGPVAGLRIDHVDGLLDPEKYLTDLKQECRNLTDNLAEKNQTAPVLYVEKILNPGDILKKEWGISGTTGYDFLNVINGLFIDKNNELSMRQIYNRFTKSQIDISDLIVTCKKLIMLVSNASELRVLAVQLDRISEQHRWSRDFTQESLRFALREIIACFPVYRTYICPQDKGISANDRGLIQKAIKEAKKRNPSTSNSLFDFISSVLLMEDPTGLTEDQIKIRRDFVLRFQQFTGPVMAKGLEDTAFYRYYPLASINEVGGNLAQFGTDVQEFHHLMEERHQEWPHSLSATSTHDTKRSEDVRCRINVLSENPENWSLALERWANFNRRYKTLIDDRLVPDENEEYLIYQTLLGTWPRSKMNELTRSDYLQRIQTFVNKAVREAKIHTSWVRPYDDYEKAIHEFIGGILNPTASPEFLSDFDSFFQAISYSGIYNSLSQTLLKITCPGTPDFYQGTEIMDFSLVDPDNRRPVDYAQRKELLEKIKTSWLKNPKTYFSELRDRFDENELKMFVTWRCLQTRLNNPTLFSQGNYYPLTFHGPQKNNLLGFLRKENNTTAIILVGRFFKGLKERDSATLKKNIWDNNFLEIPKINTAEIFKDIFTEEIRDLRKIPNSLVPLSQLLNNFSLSLLISRSE